MDWWWSFRLFCQSRQKIPTVGRFPQKPMATLAALRSNHIYIYTHPIFMVYLRALMRGSEGEYDVCGFSRMRSQAGVRSKIDKDLQLEHPKLYLKLPISGLGANSVSQQSMLWSWAPSGMMLGSRLPQIWRLSKARGTVCDSSQRLPCSERQLKLSRSEGIALTLAFSKSL